MRIVLILLVLLLLGFAAYPIGLRGWGSYHYRAAEQALARRDFRQASEHLRHCLGIRPDDPAARVLAAQAARRQDDYAQALEHLRTFRLEKTPPKAAALEYQLIRVQQGDLSETDGLLDRCVNRPEEPEAPLILEALIEGHLKVVYQTSLREMASAGREQLVDVMPAQRLVDLWSRQRSGQADRVQELVWRGRLQTLARDHSQAQSHFRAALALDPNHFQARLDLATLLAGQSPEEAADHLQLLHQREPDNSRVALRLAALRRSLGQLKDARQLLDEILASNPDEVDALIERGKVALDERQLEEAERCLRRALTQMPNHAAANLALSHCLSQAGKTTEAKRFRERFEQLEAESKRDRDAPALGQRRQP